MWRPFSSEFGEAELATAAARSSMHLGVCKPFADPCGAANTENRKPAVSSKSLRLRGKDSNLDYLIQSQASYH